MFALLRNFKLLIGLFFIFLMLYSGGHPIEFLKEKLYWVADKIAGVLDWFKTTDLFEFFITMKKGFVNTDILNEIKKNGSTIVDDFIQDPDRTRVDGVNVFDEEKSWETEEGQ